MSKKKFLLGATVDNNLVFGEMEVTMRNGYREFTASFDEVRPFNGSERDLTEYMESYLDGLDKEWLYDACERYDCKPSDLAECIADECNDPRDIIDCSLYPEEMEINGDYWYFESGSCGQHDTRGTMEVYTDEEAYNLLHDLWDKYHLHEIDENVLETVNNLIDRLEAIDEDAWIENYIRENLA